MSFKEQIRALKLGDRIQFRSSTRFGDKVVWRIVTGWEGEKPTVRFRGQNEFLVELGDILAIET